MRLVSPAKGRCRVHQQSLDHDALHSLWTSLECRRTRTQEALIRDASFAFGRPGSTELTLITQLRDSPNSLRRRDGANFRLFGAYSTLSGLRRPISALAGRVEQGLRGGLLPLPELPPRLDHVEGDRRTREAHHSITPA